MRLARLLIVVLAAMLAAGCARQPTRSVVVETAAASELDGLSAAIGYYGGNIAKNADLKPKVPTLLHFGDQDQSIPMSDVEIVKQKRSDCEIHVYHAGHGFSCDERGSYNEAAHKAAWERTLGWLTKYVG